jgi:3-methyladenine DNA glycosylase AlkD
MFTTHHLHEQIQKSLASVATDERKHSTMRFFKEPIRCYGVSNPDAKKIGQHFYQLIQKENKTFIWEMAEKLFASGWIEEALIACQWVFKRKREFKPEDLLTFEKWIHQYVHNWAVCDTFCNQSMGSLLIKYPELTKVLYQWAQSENRWVRRASAVSLIVPAKKGIFEEVIFDMANLLLTDSDPMVQKGYGWMLKVYSQVKLEMVFQYVMRNESLMPRTAFRYAIEKMPMAFKDQAMKRGRL